LLHKAFCAALVVGAALTSVVGSKAHSDTVDGVTIVQVQPQITEEEIDSIGVELGNEMKAGGMREAAAGMIACYGNNFQEELVRLCVVTDLTLMEVDQQVRDGMLGTFGRDPGPSVPELSQDAFGARLRQYGHLAFPGGPQQLFAYAPESSIREIIARAIEVEFGK
jgi:hypothetical protein